MKTGFFSLNYFIEMLNLVTYVFEWRKLLNSHFMEKIAANDQIDRRRLVLKKI